MVSTSTNTVTVVLSGSEEALTYSGVQAYEENRTLLVARAGEIIARFQLSDIKHWYTDSS